MVMANSRLAICTWQRICRFFVKYRITTQKIAYLAPFKKTILALQPSLNFGLSIELLASIFLKLRYCMEVEE